MIAPRKSPALAGETMCNPTLDEPALTPAMVTRLGSPPNALREKQHNKKEMSVIYGQTTFVNDTLMREPNHEGESGTVCINA